MWGTQTNQAVSGRCKDREPVHKALSLWKEITQADDWARPRKRVTALFLSLIWRRVLGVVQARLRMPLDKGSLQPPFGLGPFQAHLRGKAVTWQRKEPLKALTPVSQIASESPHTKVVTCAPKSNSPAAVEARRFVRRRCPQSRP